MQIARACGVVLLAFVAGCDDPKPTPTAPTLAAPTTTVAPASSSSVMSSPETSPPASSASTATPDPKPPEAAGSHHAKEGEMCGGFAGIPCEKGLVCTNVMPVADGAGTCRKGKK